MNDINSKNLYINNNLKKLKEQAKLRLCMPGHKGVLLENILDCGYDITETGDNDNLHAPHGIIKRSQESAAEAFNAGHTFFITAGATAAMHIMLLSLGSVKLIVAGAFHKSAVYGMGIADITPVFCAGTAEDIGNALDENPDSAGVLITSPDYYGRSLDLMKIGETIRRRGRLMLADESHGSHFYFGEFPATAAHAGADIWINSLHKTMPALTQAALLNIGRQSKISYCDARRAMSALHTTSPSYPVMASIEYAIEYMRGADIKSWIKRCLNAARQINGLGGYKCRACDDPTRLVINTLGRGWYGFDALEKLYGYGIICEMADTARIVLLSADIDFEDRLASALERLEQRTPIQPAKEDIQTAGAEYPMSIRQAMLAKGEFIGINECEGRISACAAGAYPPGTPCCIPGQRIDKRAIAALTQNGISMFGLDNNKIAVVKEG